MSSMHDEQHELAINPIVTESIQHNGRTLQNIRSLTSSLAGICAGTLGLESYPGFLFYLVSHVFVSLLVFVGPAASQPPRFFYSTWGELWAGDLIGGVMGYVLTWTLFYNLVRA